MFHVNSGLAERQRSRGLPLGYQKKPITCADRTLRTKIRLRQARDRRPFITVAGPAISGYFAVEMWWNPQGFWEPWQTGFGRYATKEEAAEEAKHWAESGGMPYRP